MAFLDFLSPIFGSKPDIAQYQPVDLQADQLKALEGDLAAWPDIQNIGNLFQQYLLQGYETAIPGFSDILKMGGSTTKQMLSTAGEELSGKIPQDVQDAVQRSTAFQSLMGGTAGSGMARALTARDFGLTSLDLINQGAGLAGQAGNAAQRWAALSGAGQAGGVMQGMLVSPQQQAALDMQQNLIKRNIQQQRFNVAAAPDPAAKGLSDIVANLTAAYLGGMGGGGKGGGGGGAPQMYGASQMGVGDLSSNYGATSASTGANMSPGMPNDQYALPTSVGNDYFSGYGGVAPGYSGIQNNPFTDYINTQQFYGANFPTGG